MKLTPAERRKILDEVTNLLADDPKSVGEACVALDTLKGVDDQRIDLEDAGTIIVFLTGMALRKG